MKEIKTERLVLRQLRDEDAHALAHAANNFEIAKWLNELPHPYTLEDAKWFISSIRNTEHEPYGVFNNDEFIGVIGTVGVLGLGYWFAQDTWGRGYGSEAARAVVDLHFGDPKTGNLLSGYVVNNIGSARIQEKLGFRVTGRNMVQRKYFDEIEQIKTVLTHDEWLASYKLPIRTPRLSLRPFKIDDWKRLQKIAGNNQIAPMLGTVKNPWNEKDVKEWIDVRRYQGGLNACLGIEIDGELIGMVAAARDFPLGYFVDRNYWGKGQVTEALMAIICWHYNFSDSDIINADAFMDNPASIRVLEKCGFKKVGEDVVTSLARVEPAPVFLYRLTRTDFESLKP